MPVCMCPGVSGGGGGAMAHLLAPLLFARGGGSQELDIMLKTPPRAKFKKGGGFGGGFKGVFRCAGILSAERAPRPPKPPPPNEIHSVGHLRTVGYAAQV